MLEADSTCDRLGILVGGKLKALGDTARLKRVYGAGHHLELTVNVAKLGVSEREALSDKLLASLRQAGVDTSHIILVEFVVTSDTRARLTFGLGVDKKRASDLSRTSLYGTGHVVPTQAEHEIEQENMRRNSRASISAGGPRLSEIQDAEIAEKAATSATMLSKIFRWAVKDPLGAIEDYSVGEPTMEQVCVCGVFIFLRKNLA